MGVKDIFTWYQKKIGTYEKQTWESVEQKILNGLPHVQAKNAKPNAELIDLDLLRGSSFAKVKPKQGFMIIAKVATLRCVLLPLYSKWWMQQTSVLIFTIMFAVYLSLLANIAIYFRNSPLYIADKEKSEESITCMELIVPFALTWILSLVHSQIAATVPASESQKSKLTKCRNLRRKPPSSARKTEGFSPDSVASTRHVKKRINFNLTTNKPERTDKITNNNADKDETFLRKRRSKDKIQVDDDGFESLNGNGSRTSEEETHPLRPPQNVFLSSQKRCDDWIKKQYRTRKANTESRLSTEPESDAETETIKAKMPKKRAHIPTIKVIDIACDTDDEYGFDNNSSTIQEINEMPTLSTNEWVNMTTNSEDISCSSDLDEVSETNRDDYDHAIFNPPSVRASCTIWKYNETKKVELSTLEISTAIIEKVESTSQSMDYFYIGVIISTIHSLIPAVFRLCNFTLESNTFADGQYTIFELLNTIIEKLPSSLTTFVEAAFGSTLWERWIIITACVQRWILACLFFFLLAVAEITFKQRFLYAKLFSHLTSFRRAQQSELPHFRLNKVKNIKTWLSVRSYLKQRGPQESVDVIVSTAFIITLLLLSFLCVEVLKETGALNTQYHVEVVIWCIGLGILLLRFMTLGTKINKKYRNLSVLITEQINLHLQIEQKPNKKEELTLANNVLKLAIDLIKELQSPFKISGLSANSILYNTTKLIILSALSGILSEVLGFKLKLHKIKIK